MSKYWVPGADGIKYSKIEMTSSRHEESQIFGARPNFKRKKSFWRAFRRGAVWALMEVSHHSMLIRLNQELYNIPKENWLTDVNIPPNIIYFIRKNNE